MQASEQKAPILELKGLSKSFGALAVINDISMRVERGEALGILGPNGAGKTTLLNLVSGDLAVTRGSVFYLGKDVTAASPHERSRGGIGRTHQIPKPFEGMTVFENVLVGATYGRQQSQKDAQEHSAEVLKLTGLHKYANRLAGDLRLLDRKRLELAKAMALKPELLLLDEIAGGLVDHEVPELLEVIRNLRKQGVTIIWIEHIVHALVSVVDRMIAINFGSILAEGSPEELLRNETLKEIYLGVDAEPIGHKQP
jgi:branched-chain amino acid transport system ATP-binding protein